MLYLPALRALRRAFPDSDIHGICASTAAREFFEHCAEIDCVTQISASRTVGFMNAVALLRGALALRRERFDLSLAVFPSNRFACAVLSALAGARWRLAHRYSAQDYFRNLNVLIHAAVPADAGLHDVEQNMTLVDHVTGGTSRSISSADLRLSIPAALEDQARDRFDEWGFTGKRVTGMHVTSFPDMTCKRWDGSRFHELITRILQAPDTAVAIFGTDDERAYIEEVVDVLRERVKICTGMSLMETVALVSRCDAFVSNDSGLMHMAVCVGVPTLGIFGPTNPVRTKPYGSPHRVVQPNHPCTACYRYPFGRSPDLKNCIRRSCLQDLGVDEVYCAYRQLTKEE